MRFSTYAAVSLSVAATSAVSYVIPRVDTLGVGPAVPHVAQNTSDNATDTIMFPAVPGTEDNGPTSYESAHTPMHVPQTQRDVEDVFDTMLRREPAPIRLRLSHAKAAVKHAVGFGASTAASTGISEVTSNAASNVSIRAVGPHHHDSGRRQDDEVREIIRRLFLDFE